MTDPWPLDQRKQMMRDVVSWMAKHRVLKIENAPAYANTYGIPVACVEAEMMRHLSESDGGK